MPCYGAHLTGRRGVQDGITRGGEECRRSCARLQGGKGPGFNVKMLMAALIVLFSAAVSAIAAYRMYLVWSHRKDAAAAAALAKSLQTRRGDVRWLGSRDHARTVVVVNPYGGSKSGNTKWTTVVKPLLDAVGKEYDVEFTRTAADVAAIAKRVDAGPGSRKHIMLLSGDGTFHGFLNALAERGPAVTNNVTWSILPCGSMNCMSATLSGVSNSNNVYAVMRALLISPTGNGVVGAASASVVSRHR